MQLLIPIVCLVAICSAAEMNLLAAKGVWPLGSNKAELYLYFQSTTTLDSTCHGMAPERCMVRIRACPVSDFGNVIIPDECKQYVKKTSKRQTNEDISLEEQSCIDQQVSFKGLMEKPRFGALQLSGLEGNRMYQIHVTEVVDGEQRPWRTFDVATPEVEGETVRRIKKGLDLQAHLHRLRALQEEENRSDLRRQLIKLLYQYIQQ